MSPPPTPDNAAGDAELRRSQVAEYYGETLHSSSDLKTSACCPVDALPSAYREIVDRIHPEVRDKFYGCGSPVPDMLQGTTVIDLGCGTGRDVYVASALVGPAGKVIGIDMTEKQLEVAQKHQKYHADILLGDGTKSNVDLRKAVIEDLHSAGVEDESVDVVMSNCVLNLSAAKETVFREIWRVLRPGGEIYFSDIYADRRLPAEAANDPVLVGECLGGALYIEDFRRIMSDVGFRDVRVVSSAPLAVTDEGLKTIVRDVNYFSVTFRAFKLPGLEDRAEDYGQTATYSGSGSVLKFDAMFTFAQGVPKHVDGNTAAILQSSRYNNCFTVTPRGPHQGLDRPDMEWGFVRRLGLQSYPPKPAVKTTEGGSQCCVVTAQESKAAGNGTECCGGGSAAKRISGDNSFQSPCCTPEQKAEAVASGAKCCGASEKQGSLSSVENGDADKSVPQSSPCCRPN